jgi:hypothetical protein
MVCCVFVLDLLRDVEELVGIEAKLLLDHLDIRGTERGAVHLLRALLLRTKTNDRPRHTHARKNQYECGPEYLLQTYTCSRQPPSPNPQKLKHTYAIIQEKIRV